MQFLFSHKDGDRLLTASNEMLMRVFDLQDESAGK